jgi:PRC-barrel domain protein
LRSVSDVAAVMITSEAPVSAARIIASSPELPAQPNRKADSLEAKIEPRHFSARREFHPPARGCADLPRVMRDVRRPRVPCQRERRNPHAHSRAERLALEAPVPSSAHARAAHRLIASDRVEGTLVYRLNGLQLGVVERLMINKVSGQVAYAVMKATLPGMGEKRFPVTWEALHYNRHRGAYLADITEKDIRLGPGVDSGFDWGERNDVTQIRPFQPPTFWGSSY